MKQITDIEAQFDSVVRKIGGTLVRDLLDSKSPHFENADYFFSEENIIAELKILEKDPKEDGELERKVQAKFDKWMSEGKVLIYGTTRVESKSLPIEIQWELFRIYSEPVRRVIKKANRQIRETKEHLKCPTAQGLVIIINEANRELQPEHFGFATHQSLASDFSSISGASLITVNIATSKPGFSSSLRLWMDYIRNDVPAIDNSFLRRLRGAWTSHYASLIDEPVPLFEHETMDLASLKYE